jgi:hypothetical protein
MITTKFTINKSNQVVPTSERLLVDRLIDCQSGHFLDNRLDDDSIVIALITEKQQIYK